MSCLAVRVIGCGVVGNVEGFPSMVTVRVARIRLVGLIAVLD